MIEKTYTIQLHEQQEYHEKLLGFVYFRRDEHNLEDVFMVDLETEIPNDWYRMDKWFPIEIYTNYNF